MTASLDWLLEEDDPGVRYLALRDVVGMPPDDPGLIQAKQQAHRHGPITNILDHMQPEGYWKKPGPGYGPKYRSTVWSLILLAQLGADMKLDGRIHTAVNYYLEHAVTEQGKICYNKDFGHTIDCLQGNICYALQALGCRDERLKKAFEWMARSVTGDGVAPINNQGAELKYEGYQCGPLFACGANDKLPCSWAAVKIMIAFGVLPKKDHTPLIRQAVAQGVDFLFSVDPLTAEWPHPHNAKPRPDWWKFGFPVFYNADLLQLVEALALLGYGHDPRLASTIQLVREKQDAAGLWPLELEYNGKTWGTYGTKGQPNKWVTLRALRALKWAG